MSTAPDTIVDTNDIAANDAGAGTGTAEPLTEVEQLAVEMGWKPETEFSGDKTNWRPAVEWVRTTHLMNKRLTKELGSMKDTVDRLASTAAKTTERMLKEQAEEIGARFAQAVENKDTAAAAKASRDMQQLEREATTETGGDVEATFARQNPWYGTNDEATAYAVSVSRMNAKKPVAEQLELVDKAMRKRFPELYDDGATATKTPIAVAAPTSRGLPPKRERGFADLPAAAKEAAERYAKMAKDKHGKDPEEVKKSYAKDYWADQAA